MSAPVPQLDFAVFEAHLTSLCDVVAGLLEEQPDLDLTRPIFCPVASELGSAHDLRQFFFEFARALLTMDSGAQMKQQPSFMRQCERFGHVHSVPIEGTDYVEYLTATALALYFLGEPFSHPWERVLRWVEQSGGGLSNGACAAKAIGDIIRAARIGHCGAQKLPETVEGQAEPPLLVLSHMPLVLHQSYITQAEVQTCLPPAAHILGHCYELLQMRLYANERLPFRYFVPTGLVNAKLVYDAPHDPGGAWRASLGWMCRQVFPQAFTGQVVQLIDVTALPPVFLNLTAGLYTSPRPPEGTKDAESTPLPATYLRSARLKLYRATLNSIAVDDAANLLAVGRGPPERQLELGSKLFDSQRMAEPAQ